MYEDRPSSGAQSYQCRPLKNITYISSHDSTRMKTGTKVPSHMENSSDPLLVDFIDSCPWLLQHQSLLESLRSNYQKDSLVLKSLKKTFDDLDLAGYNLYSKEADISAVSDLIDAGKMSDEMVDTVEASGNIEHIITEGLNTVLENSKEKSDKKEFSESATLKNIRNIHGDTPKQRDADVKRIYMLKTKKADYSKDITKPENEGYLRPKRFKSHVHLLSTSLRKPPETSISKVKVSTKVTSLNGNEYQPINSDTNKLSLKRIFNGSVAKNLIKLRMEQQQITSDVGNMPMGLVKRRGEPGEQNTVVSGKKSPHVFKESGNSENMAVSSKKSVVSRNLPLYILEQIQVHESNTNGKLNRLTEGVSIHEAPNNIYPQGKRKSKTASSGNESLKFKSSKSAINFQSVSGSPANTNKDRMMDQRINNLLANSLSLYHQSESNRYDYDTGHMSIMESGNNDSGISDADKEYVSAYLFARSLEDFDENLTYENLASELQENGSFRTIRSGLDQHNNESEYEDNIVDGGSEMRLFSHRD
ncbi:hypothetical protein JCM33374_g5416 [Metschnikowia sp. JCM 33374]|nr:hypothetical protein JCM33374_g5416 [Metschnikowia sp. JCM 33374]